MTKLELLCEECGEHTGDIETNKLVKHNLLNTIILCEDCYEYLRTRDIREDE
jgi:hypothetical protein